MSKTIIHVNQHNIKKNKKHGLNHPVLTLKSGKTNTYTHEASIVVDGFGEVAKVVYRPNKPLSCGATCWIETNHTVIAKEI